MYACITLARKVHSMIGGSLTLASWYNRPKYLAFRSTTSGWLAVIFKGSDQLTSFTDMAPPMFTAG